MQQLLVLSLAGGLFLSKLFSSYIPDPEITVLAIVVPIVAITFNGIRLSAHSVEILTPEEQAIRMRRWWAAFSAVLGIVLGLYWGHIPLTVINIERGWWLLFVHAVAIVMNALPTKPIPPS